MVFYMPAKPSKWGFKMHSMVDSNTHYIYDLIFIPGKNYKNLITEDKNKKFAQQIVNTLVDRLPGTGYRIFCDSWYASVDLVKDMTEKNFSIITSLRSNAIDLPNKELISNSSKKYAYNNENHLIIQEFKDKKTIYFISNENLSTDEIKKLYNFQNRGVDKMNQSISYYNVERKVYKWWKKLFFWYINSNIQ